MLRIYNAYRLWLCINKPDRLRIFLSSFLFCLLAQTFGLWMKKKGDVFQNTWKYCLSLLPIESIVLCTCFVWKWSFFIQRFGWKHRLFFASQKHLNQQIYMDSALALNSFNCGHSVAIYFDMVNTPSHFEWMMTMRGAFIIGRITHAHERLKNELRCCKSPTIISQYLSLSVRNLFSLIHASLYRFIVVVGVVCWEW